MFRKEYPFGDFYYQFGPVFVDWKYKSLRCGRLSVDWGKKKSVEFWDDDSCNYHLEAELDSEQDYPGYEVWEIEFPRCAPCKSGFGDCSCI